jgi:MFS family permease
VRTVTNQYLRLLTTNRDFRILYVATLISLGGDWFLTVALYDLVLEISGSATLATAIFVCQTLPIFLATPFAGHLVDRVDRRKVMVSANLAGAGAALVPLLTHSHATLVFVYLGVVAIAICAAYFEPASMSALPNLVASEDLAAANVLMGSTWGTMLAVGAGVGGLFTARFGRGASFVIDALSFVIAALLLLTIRARFSERDPGGEQHPPLGEAVRETLAYARDHKRVLALLTCKGGYGIGAGVVAMLGVFGREVFLADAFGIGILYAARGVGALVGPFLGRAMARTDEAMYRSIPVATVIFGLGYIGLAAAPLLAIGVFAVIAGHLGGGAQWQFSNYGLQREVPDRLRGRVFAADHGFVTLTMAISSLMAGVLADLAGARIATAAVASLCIAWGVFWGVWTRGLWNRDV